MGFFSHLLRPDKQFEMMATAPFQKRTDMPWLQGTVRNTMHGVVGDEGASNFEQKYLGDTKNGYYKPSNDPANQSPVIGQGLQSQVNPQATGSDGGGNDVNQKALLAWLQSQQSKGLST